MKVASKFYYHWEKEGDRMLVHHKEEVYNVRDICCHVTNITQRNEEHPKLVMTGFAREIKIKNDTAFIY